MAVILTGRNSRCRGASYDTSAMTTCNLVNGITRETSLINEQRLGEKPTIGSDCRQPSQTKSGYPNHQHQTKNVQPKLHFDGDQQGTVKNRSDECSESDAATVHSRHTLERPQSSTDKRERHKPLPFTPEPTESEIAQRIEEAQSSGLSCYIHEDTVDDIMFEASVKNRAPLEMFY
ncbi:hypothetical protein P879_11386 [Paragonimus westermani]|uniref:Uncharacterized protein n=1 Tax=Paragonimus westermani TaxID=34504 RepID=A0A8T0D762_9TREM|nr:hypothetical protein P879_11386 [Paragonimus westermani]